jgi:hypothetical protein
MTSVSAASRSRLPKSVKHLWHHKGDWSELFMLLPESEEKMFEGVTLLPVVFVEKSDAFFVTEELGAPDYVEPKELKRDWQQVAIDDKLINKLLSEGAFLPASTTAVGGGVAAKLRAAANKLRASVDCLEVLRNDLKKLGLRVKTDASGKTLTLSKGKTELEVAEKLKKVGWAKTDAVEVGHGSQSAAVVLQKDGNRIRVGSAFGSPVRISIVKLGGG